MNTHECKFHEKATDDIKRRRNKYVRLLKTELNHTNMVNVNYIHILKTIL